MKVFNRLNISKIPLSNAELIKALPLQVENSPLMNESPSEVEHHKRRREEPERNSLGNGMR